MTVNLIDGQFSKTEAIEIITHMIHVKVKFHENKISGSDSEEDLKMRERKIRNLQKELFEVRQYLDQHENVNMNSQINF